jgi:mono/diheme cytochrome c family protein
MIAAVIFIVTFLLLGLGVLAFAFGGRSGGRRRRGAPSRASRRFIAVTVTIVIVALGVAVPLAIAVVNKNDHAKSAPGGVDLDAAQANGRAVFGRYCATCHTLKASNAVGKVGPNLDVLHPPKGLILDAIANGRARGQGQMPAGLVDGQDAQDVAAYVAAAAGQG